MAEEGGFEVVDKRRVRTGEPEAGSGEESPGSPDEPTEADDWEASSQEVEAEEDVTGADDSMPVPELTVSGILRMTLGLLNDLAWISMGLLANPVTGKVEKNLTEARRAIDALAELAKHLDAECTPDEKRELQVLLSNLRINFVRQSGGS